MFAVDENTIWFYDDLVDEMEAEWIGGISIKMFKEAMDGFDGKDFTIRIDSPGGSVRPALSIYNMIQNYPGKVTAIIDSWAASSLSYIPMAADEVLIAENGLIMTHAPWTFAFGNAEDLMEVVDALEAHQQSLAKGYAAKTGKDLETINAELLTGENWFTAEQAKDYGLVDGIVEAKVEVKNRVNPKVYGYKQLPDEWRDSSVQRFAALCPDFPTGGLSSDELEQLAAVRGRIGELVKE